MNLASVLPAEIHERLLASVIDRFLLALVLLVALLIVFPAEQLAPLLTPENTRLNFVVFGSSLAYYTLFIASPTQATPGQRLMRIRVVRADGRRMGYEVALMRFLAFIIPTLPTYTTLLSQQISSVLFLWLTVFWLVPMFTTPQRIAMHDRLSGTRVVRVE